MPEVQPTLGAGYSIPRVYKCMQTVDCNMPQIQPTLEGEGHSIFQDLYKNRGGHSLKYLRSMLREM